MRLMATYPRASTTLAPTDEQLEADFRMAQSFISANDGSSEAVRLSVVRDWIAQERRARIPGIGRDLPALHSAAT
jgi:hypothetical protein